MSNTKKGLLSIFITYTAWGLQPLYWKSLSHLDIQIVMAARIIWSFILCGIALWFKRAEGENTGKMAAREKLILFVAAFMLGGNWIINIYAAVANRVIEASLGHFITPVMTIFIGLAIFREKMNLCEKIGFISVLIGGTYILFKEGSIPLVALLLVVSFVAYTILMKMAESDPLDGFFAQMAFLLPVALWVIFNNKTQWNVVFSARNGLLLFSTGIFTAVPMLLFAYGVKNVRLASMGYIQYYAPTISFLLGVFAFNEPFDAVRLTGFVFIWIGAFAASVWPMANNLLKKYQKMRKIA